MSLSEIQNGKEISLLSTAEDNFEIIEGGFLLSDKRIIMINSSSSFVLSDGCVCRKKSE